MTPEDEKALGAYGLRLDVPVEARHLLRPAEQSWERLALHSRVGDGTLDADRVSVRRAELRLQTGGFLVLDRDEGTATYTTPHTLGPDELVHPYLAPAAAMMAFWAGRIALHAGAFVVAGRAWALLGERGSGKSSTLAWLARRGLPIVTDDILVLDGAAVLPGPRTVDLRADAAKVLGVGEELGRIGARDRWRFRVDADVDRVDLAGFVALDWGDRTHIEPIPPAARFGLVQEQAAVRLPPRDPRPLLDVVALPAWRFSRSLGWDGFEGAVEALLDALGR